MSSNCILKEQYVFCDKILRRTRSSDIAEKPLLDWLQRHFNCYCRETECV